MRRLSLVFLCAWAFALAAAGLLGRPVVSSAMALACSAGAIVLQSAAGSASEAGITIGVDGFAPPRPGKRRRCGRCSRLCRWKLYSAGVIASSPCRAGGMRPDQKRQFVISALACFASAAQNVC